MSNHENASPNLPGEVVVLTDDRKRAFREHQKMQIRRLLATAQEDWRALDNARSGGPLFTVETFSDEIDGLLKKSGKFPELANEGCISIASKKSRVRYK